MSILITGATGKQGGAVARHLLARNDMQVHALVRSASSSAALDLRALGANLIEGSFDDAASLQLACQNKTAVFLNVTPSFRNDGAEVRHATNVLLAARAAATVTTLVYPSVSGIDQHESFPAWTTWADDHPLKAFFRDKAAIEEMVREAGFANWVILRPPVFMTNYLSPTVEGYFPELVSGVFRTALGPGKRTMLISPDDIGQIAAAAIAEPRRFSGRAIDIGAEALTAEEVAGALAEVGGREIRVEYIPDDEARELAKTNMLIDVQRWYWERQAGFDPKQVAEEFGLRFTSFRDFLRANEALLK
ncbi:NAD(P)-binding protein [Aspergillus steynii IBT 23096]|uniref:NAD(P)-binding protein n=1 Tax=Aspergillus steynii IBT 23096 TaxID=1392250 RepID=A0A2I2FT74_9EURO|nr:NAD(P)-binding protein [Aspergillus steynii IBT 23096]PLB43777.1 NAD(P)-binding protein [Aspergillus steynii IBT 23096]